jgi:hypothetical protein
MWVTETKGALQYLNVNGIVRYACWTAKNKGCHNINVIGDPETTL